MTKIDPVDLAQKQNLLNQHRRNLHYLAQQSAQYGLDQPLALHNALRSEQEAIAALERELAAWGAPAQSAPQWQALVVDPDNHWRKIIAKNIGQLGGVVVECQTIPSRKANGIITNSALAVVGVPDTPEATSIRQWIKNVVKLGQHLPLILLVCWDNRDTAIALRQAIYAESRQVTATTIFKDNFDPYWFSRVVHKILTQ
ncbi:MAG: hypothetical protein EHM12_12865 [Dehalococcoidia bacterium]|nr:MAG: hypothetical protein EHM12_12865 [Dehalococcoidia bacterium]